MSAGSSPCPPEEDGAEEAGLAEAAGLDWASTIPTAPAAIRAKESERPLPRIENETRRRRMIPFPPAVSKGKNHIARISLVGRRGDNGSARSRRAVSM